MLQYQTLASGRLQCNGTLIWDTDTRDAVLIDPTDNASPFLKEIADRSLLVREVLLTHGHVDHAASVCQVARKLEVTPRMHPADLPVYRSIPSHGAAFGIPAESMDLDPAPLHHLQVITVNPSFAIQVLHVPGHTPGGVSFYIKEIALAVVGDTLFRESVGRTDLPGGNTNALVRSISEVLYALPPETLAIPGHGPTTTIGHEMHYNPYVRSERPNQASV